MSNKTTAVLESLRNLKVWLEKEGIVADECDDAIARLAELQGLSESLKLANSDAQHRVRQLEAENKRLRETGQKVLEAMETLRGVVAVEHNPTLIYTAQAYLNLQQALQRKEPDDEAK